MEARRSVLLQPRDPSRTSIGATARTVELLSPPRQTPLRLRPLLPPRRTRSRNRSSSRIAVAVDPRSCAAPSRDHHVVARTPARRISLDTLLLIVTLGVGWLIWSIVVWGRGQSPGKQILGMRVLRTEHLEANDRWGMLGRGFAKWSLPLPPASLSSATSSTSGSAGTRTPRRSGTRWQIPSSSTTAAACFIDEPHAEPDHYRVGVVTRARPSASTVCRASCART